MIRRLVLPVVLLWTAGALIPSAQAAADADRAAVQKEVEQGANLGSRARAVLLRARTRLDQGDAAGALDVLSGWLDGKPDRDTALLRYARARALAALSRAEEALVDVRRAVEIEPRFMRAWFKRAELAYAAGLYGEAAEAFGRGWELDPDPDPELLHYRGVCLLLDGRPRAAVDVLAGLIQKQRQRAEISWYRALVAADLACPEPGRASGLLEGMLDDFASDPEAWDLASRHAAACGRYAEAASGLRILNDLEPLDSAGLRRLGDLYGLAGVPLEAARFYARARESAPQITEPDSAARNARRREVERLATAWLAAHRPAAAAQALRPYLDRDPAFGRGWVLLGYAALAEDDRPAARDHWERARLAPDTAAEATGLLEALGAPRTLGAP